MKLLLRMILIGALTYFLCLILPWWVIVPIGVVSGAVAPSGAFNSFVSGFLGVGLVWMGYAWKLNVENDSSFSKIILEIIPLGDSLVLVIVIGLISGLSGGLATMTGALIRATKKKRNNTGYYQ